MKKKGLVEDYLVILSKQTIEAFYREEKPGDLIALYTTYYFTAKWQETNQPRATTTYIMKKLGWGKTRVISAKKKLIEMKLIEEIKLRNKKGIFGKNFIKINYIWSNTREEYHSTAQPLVEKATGGQKAAYALSENKRDALSENIHMHSAQGAEVSLEDFFPKEADQKPWTHQDKAEVLHILERINPALKKHYERPVTWKIIGELFEMHGVEESKQLANLAVFSFGRTYAPTVTTPQQLFNKASALFGWYKGEVEKSKTKKSLVSDEDLAAYKKSIENN